MGGLCVTYSNPIRYGLVAVYDVGPERARELAALYEYALVYESLEAFAAADLDAVSVATPDFAHAEAALAVLHAGRHLLLEKPIATTLDESLAILEAARSQDVVFMVDHHNRWSPPFIDARETIASGGIGDVRLATFRLNDSIYVPTRYISWAAASSVLWFLGPHSIDTLRWLLDDEVVEVYAVRGDGVLRGLGVDTPDYFVLTIKFRRGAVATVEHSWIVSDAMPSLFDLKCQVQGASGTIFIDASHNRALETYTTETSSGWPHNPYRDTTLMPVQRGRQAGFAAASIRHFIDCVAEDRLPQVSGLDGLRAVEVLLAAEKSVAMRAPVAVELHEF
jgi:predicted dehydrogenase